MNLSKSKNMSRAFGADFPKYEPRLRRGFPKIRAAPSARIFLLIQALGFSQKRSRRPQKIALGVESEALELSRMLEGLESCDFDPFVNAFAINVMQKPY